MLHKWLSYIDQNVRINEIGIPGTHDTASVSGTGGHMMELPLTYTQRLDVGEQLKNGARVLDMRVAYRRSEVGTPPSLREEVKMCHGPIIFDVTLAAQLRIIKSFLAINKSEFVALMFQQQGSAPKEHHKQRATDLIAEKVINAFPPTMRFQPGQAGGQWPTVGDLAGKIIVFSRLHRPRPEFFDVSRWGHNSVSGAFDVGTTGLQIRLQDRFTKVTTATGHTKKTYHSMFGSSTSKVNEAKLHLFNRMRYMGNEANTLKVNHLSHSLKSTYYRQPYMLGELLNPKLKEKLEEPGVRYKGFLMLDDLNEGIAQSIVDSNEPHFRVGGGDAHRGNRAKLLADLMTR